MNVEKVDTKEMTIDEAKNSGATCLLMKNTEKW